MVSNRTNNIDIKTEREAYLSLAGYQNVVVIDNIAVYSEPVEESGYSDYEYFNQGIFDFNTSQEKGRAKYKVYGFDEIHDPWRINGSGLEILLKNHLLLLYEPVLDIKCIAGKNKFRLIDTITGETLFKDKIRTDVEVTDRYITMTKVINGISKYRVSFFDIKQRKLLDLRLETKGNGWLAGWDDSKEGISKLCECYYKIPVTSVDNFGYIINNHSNSTEQAVYVTEKYGIAYGSDIMQLEYDKIILVYLGAAGCKEIGYYWIYNTGRNWNYYNYDGKVIGRRYNKLFDNEINGITINLDSIVDRIERHREISRQKLDSKRQDQERQMEDTSCTI